MCQFKCCNAVCKAPAAAAAAAAARAKAAAGAAAPVDKTAAPADKTAAPVDKTATDELRRLPAQVLARYFSTAATSASQYSPAMAAELRVVAKSSSRQHRRSAIGGNGTDDNNNHISSSSKDMASRRSLQDASTVAGRRVQFADELGHSLTQVRLIEGRRRRPESCERVASEGDCGGHSTLSCHFEPPSAERALRVLGGGSCGIQLSGLRLRPDGLGVSGFALVANVGYRKRVFVRVTFNAWRSFADVAAEFVGSLDAGRDAFAFDFQCGCGGGGPGVEMLEFCLCFEAEGRGPQWDSNGGRNYRAALLPQQPPSRPVFSLCQDDSDEE